MPVFSQKRPNSISQSIAAMLSSSGELSADRAAKIEQAASATARNYTLAQKAMEELQAQREADAARRDPNRAIEYGAFASGMNVPDATQQYRAMRGEQVPLPYANDDEGNAMPPAPYASPENVTPEQKRMFNQSIAATIANVLATGKTNAEQFAHATGRQVETAVRNEATAPGLTVPQQNQLVAPFRATNREPFSNINTQGMVSNQETGTAASAAPEITQAAIAALQNLGEQRSASAGLSRVRTETEPIKANAAATRAGASATNASVNAGESPSRIERNQAVAKRAGAQANSAEALADDRRGRVTERQTITDQTTARTKFRNDPKMSGKRLGAWEPGKGFQVIDNKTKALIGHYD